MRINVDLKIISNNFQQVKTIRFLNIPKLQNNPIPNNFWKNFSVKLSGPNKNGVKRR